MSTRGRKEGLVHDALFEWFELCDNICLILMLT
jgi:hypothetical protein